jgi:hypothetical protein
VAEGFFQTRGVKPSALGATEARVQLDVMWCQAFARSALGATEARVQLDVIVIWKTLLLALVGIAVGIFASVMVARLIASLLFQTGQADPITFAGMVILLGRDCWPDIFQHEELRRFTQ